MLKFNPQQLLPIASPKELNKDLDKSKRQQFLSPRNPDYKIEYSSFCKNLLAEVEKNSKLVIEVTHDLLRKIYKMIQGKNVSIFESFVYFDINNNNAISKLEFKLGLQNFNIYFTDRELNMVWNSFERMKNLKVSFMNYLKAFVNAGALPIIKFDEATDTLVKKFTAMMQKLGNFEEAFRKLDLNHQGLITLNDFKDQCHRLHLGLIPSEVETIFSIICGKGENKDKADKNSPILGFNYRQFVKLLLKFKNMGQVDGIFFKIFKASKERKIIWKSQFQGFKAEQKPKNVGELYLRDLKTLLKELKLGITNEEVDNIIDCFESSVVSALIFERRISEGASKIDTANKEKDEQIRYLINEINSAVVRDRIPLERLFFEFDSNSSGTMEKAQFTKMI